MLWAVDNERSDKRTMKGGTMAAASLDAIFWGLVYFFSLFERRWLGLGEDFGTGTFYSFCCYYI